MIRKLTSRHRVQRNGRRERKWEKERPSESVGKFVNTRSINSVNISVQEIRDAFLRTFNYNSDQKKVYIFIGYMCMSCTQFHHFERWFPSQVSFHRNCLSEDILGQILCWWKKKILNQFNLTFNPNSKVQLFIYVWLHTPFISSVVWTASSNEYMKKRVS